MKFKQVHLDFHTSEAIEKIGEKFNKAEFQQTLKNANVDSITLFSKCHHGWSYHPTNVGKMHPNLKFDLLKEQIEACHEVGIKTPVYLSAGVDEVSFRNHMDWWYVGLVNGVVTSPDITTPMFHGLCFNTAYLDYLCNQVEEAVKNYDADGVFLDICNPLPCYCKKCNQQLIDEGKDPNSKKDHIELGNRVYLNFTKRIIESAHKYKKDLPVFFNGGHIARGNRDVINQNSHIEIESLPSGGWGYDEIHLSARYSNAINKDYLVMTGKFHNMWGEFGGFKTKNALKYEVMLASSLGAKTSVGDQMLPNGKLDDETYDLIGSAFSEIKSKEEYFENLDFVCDIALLSAEDYLYSKGEVNIPRFNIYDTGASRILNEGHYLFTVIDSKCDFSKYKVIILPDIIKPYGELEKKLNEFIKDGGKILATGESGISDNKFFADLGAKEPIECEFAPTFIKPVNNDSKILNTYNVVYGKNYDVKLNENGLELVQKYPPYFNRTVHHFCSHQHAPCSEKYLCPAVTMGKNGAYISWNAFENYATDGSIINKYAVTYVLDKLLGNEKTLSTSLYSTGITTLAKNGNKLVLNVVYAPIVKRGKDIEIIEDLPDVYNTEFEINVENKPSKIYKALSKENIDFVYENNKVKFKINKFNCHEAVIIGW